MSILFEIVKTGDLTELKKLKGEGANISEKDKSGNTLLLWAASFGHLKIVKWLLSDQGGKAQVNEKNNAGNTALLLAAAFGHLETVQYLLSNEGHANIDETNNFHNTALLQAISHGQLSIVDYLIRHYYKSGFRTEEQRKLALCSKNKAVTYYLNIYNILSQNEIDFTELTSLLQKSEQWLHGDEISFIYLLCFWIQVRSKANTLPCTVEECFGEPLMQKLMDTHQRELLLSMFQNGCILTHWSMAKGPLTLKSIVFDTPLNEQIQKKLQQCEQDVYFASIASVIEKDTAYVDYYLKPVYHSLVSAVETKDSIDNALKNPYTYHLTREGFIVKDDIAKWTAYHLCQNSGTTIQQYLDTYARTRGTSRTVYYDTVKKHANGKEQKEELLFQLGDLPDAKGERMYWVKEYPFWLKGIENALGSQKPTEQNLTLIGSQSIFLKDSFSQQIWNSKKNEPMPHTLPGNHPVFKLNLSNQQAVYCKLYPGLPGINDTLHYLYRRIFGAVGGLPWSVTGLLNIENQVIPVLFSEDAGSMIISNDERFNVLDPYTLSQQMLFTMLINAEDGKPENYTLKKNSQGLYEIFSIDNDQGLVEATIESGVWFLKTKKLAVKNLLFCLNEMNQPLDKKVISEFLSLNPIELLKSWMQDLIKLAEKYEVLFKNCKESYAQEKNLNRRSYLEVVLPIATVMKLAYKLQRLQEMLKINPHTSPIALLAEVEPVVANYYKPILDQPLSPTARFDKLISNENLYGWSKKTKGYSTTITSVQTLFDYLVPNNQPQLVSPKVALEIFKEVSEKWERLSQRQAEVMAGEVANLTQLPLKEQQALLKMIKLDQFIVKKRELLLKAIIERKNFTEIYLNGPKASLTNRLFNALLRNNKELKSLSLKEASVLTDLSVLNNMSSLEILHLTQLEQVEELSATLLQLTDLKLINLPNLLKLQINAPKLKNLTIIDCSSLNVIYFSGSVESLIIESCGDDLLLPFYRQWPEFFSLLRNLPPGFSQRLENFIKQSFPEPLISKEQKKEIYTLVKDYLNKFTLLCNPLILQLKTKQPLNAASLLVKFGYDHPLVIDTLLTYINKKIIGYVDAQDVIGAVTAIGKLQAKNNRIICCLLKLLPNPMEYKDRNINNYYSTLCARIVEVLGALQVKDKGLMEWLFDCWRNDDYGQPELENGYGLRADAAGAIGSFAENYDDVFCNLLDALKSSNNFCIYQIFNRASGKLAVRLAADENVFCNLLHTLKSSDDLGVYKILNKVPRQLAARLAADENLLFVLFKILKDVVWWNMSQYFRHQCYEVIKIFQDLNLSNEKIITSLLGALENKNESICLTLQIIRELHIKDDRVISALMRMTHESTDPQERTQVESVLNYLESKNKCINLHNTSNEENDIIQFSTLSNLRPSVVKHDDVVNNLISIVENKSFNRRRRKEAVNTLEAMQVYDERVDMFFRIGVMA